MVQLSNHIEILNILPNSNCRECGENTCIAFAVAVKQGLKKLKHCPHLKGQAAGKYQVAPAQEPELNENQKAMQKILKRLPRTNCRECSMTTCLDFAMHVRQGQKRLDQCPHCMDEKAAG